MRGAARFIGWVLIVGLTLAVGSVCARADDAEFVGVLDLTTKPDIAKQLDLTDEQRIKLDQLIGQRLDAAIKLLGTRDLDPAERQQRLETFRRESEKLGLPLLTEPQRDLLERLRLKRLNMAALAEPAVIASLQLSEEQQQSIAKLLAERKERLARGTDSERSVVSSEYERKLGQVLSDQQRTALDALTAINAASSADTPSPSPEDAEKTAAKNGKSKPATPGLKAAAHEKLRFNFRFQPWPDVLDWFAEQAGLSLVMDAPPPGTCNYTDPHDYTPAEAIDLMNSMLLVKGYTLVRREKMLFVVNLEDGIPPNLVPFITLDELDNKGKYELVSVLFPMHRLTPDEAKGEIEKLIGPQGAVVVLPRSGMLQVTETAGRLRMIRTVLQAADTPPSEIPSDLKAFEIKHAYPDDLLVLVRQLLDIPLDGVASADGSVRVAIDPATGKLLVSGRPEKLQRVAEILKTVDVPSPNAAGATAVETPQLEVYPITSADPNSVLQVLQTLMASMPDVRLATDPASGHLIALARPSQHATIRATIAQLQRDSRQVEVIRLQYVDPQLAVLAINKLFGAEPSKDGKTTTTTGPKVDADPVTRQLLIRGSEAQIAQIRSLLQKMGEADTVASTTLTPRGGNLRMVPLTGRAARNALEQLEALWPTIRQNKIRVITPSAAMPTVRPGEGLEPSGGTITPELFELLRRARPDDAAPPPTPPQKTPAPVQKTDLPAAPTPTQPAPRLAAPRSEARDVPIRFASQKTEPAATDTKEGAAPKESPTIVVAPGPGGILIASEDTEALNEFESLLTTLAQTTGANASQFTIFYLRNANAVVVAELLNQIFGGGGSSDGGGGGGLIGDLAGAALGNVGGGLVSSLLGGEGGGGIIGGSVRIIPDTRLNALIVQATSRDLDTIEQLLVVIDQQDVPESIVSPKPRMIAVVNTSAEQIAGIVREVYQEQMINVSRPRQPSPEEFMRMLRGGRGGSSSGSNAQSQAAKMSIGVDARTNSLIVSAPEPLFQEVKQLVETLDQATGDSNQAVKVVSLKRANPATVQAALSAIVGEKVKTTTTSTSSPSGGYQYQPGSDQQMQDQMRRIEFFNNLRGSFGSPGSSGGSRSGGSRPSGSTGRPSSGGFRPGGR